MTALDLVQRLSAVRLSSPFPFEVLKGLKGEVVVVSRFGRTLLPKWKLHFLLNPLLPLVISASLCIRPLKEWVSQARLGPLDSISEGFQFCRSESGKPGCSGVSSAAGFGRMASKPSHWSAPQCRQIWESSGISFRSPCAGCSSVGHIPPHSNLSGSHRDGCLGIKTHGKAKPCPARIAAMEKSEGRTWL